MKHKQKLLLLSSVSNLIILFLSVGAISSVSDNDISTLMYKIKMNDQILKTLNIKYTITRDFHVDKEARLKVLEKQGITIPEKLPTVFGMEEGITPLPV